MPLIRAVTFDTRKLTVDLEQLRRGIEHGGDLEARNQATRTMARVANATPYRTGRLFNTVTVAQVEGGWGVTYGGGLRYAPYIEKTQHPVRKGARGSRTEFTRALEELARRETAKV